MSAESVVGTGGRSEGQADECAGQMEEIGWHLELLSLSTSEKHGDSRRASPQAMRRGLLHYLPAPLLLLWTSYELELAVGDKQQARFTRAWHVFTQYWLGVLTTIARLC